MSRNIHKIYKDLYAVNRVNNVVVEKGGTTQRVASETSTISSNTSFDKLNPPNSKTLMSKMIALETHVKVVVELNGDANLGSAAVANKLYSVLRFRKNALNKNIRISRIDMNGETFTDNTKDVVDLYDHVLEDYETRHYGKYLNGGDHDLVSSFVNILNVPAEVFGNDPYSSKGLRSYQLVSVKNTVAYAAGPPVVDPKYELIFKIVEPLHHYMLKSHNINYPEKNAFYNLTSFKMSLDMQTTDLRNSIFCGLADDANFTVESVEWSQANGSTTGDTITAYVFYETPTAEAELSLLPKFDEPIYYYGLEAQLKPPVVKQLPALQAVPGNTSLATIELINYESSPVYINNFVINTIPDTMMIYAKLKDKTAVDPDVYAYIKDLAITVGNDNSNMTSFNERQLWEMSAKNGFRYSYQQQIPRLIPHPAGDAPTGIKVVGGIGSLIIIRAADLNLPSNLSEGVSLNTNISIKCTLGGNHNEGGARNYDLYATTFVQRVVEVKSGSAGSSENLFSADMLTSATPMVDKEISRKSYDKLLHGGKKGKGYRLGGGKALSGSQLADMADKTVF